jgi:hypothetical protein
MFTYRTALRAKYLALMVGAAFFSAMGSPAQAVIVDDAAAGATTYWGGQEGHARSDADVVGTLASFDVLSMEVTRIVTSTVSSDLKIEIKMNYTPGTVGTGFGDLFMGSTSSVWSPDTSNPDGANFANDTYNANKARFDYVVNIDNSTSPGAGGAATVHKLDTVSPGSDVRQSYWPTANGDNPPNPDFDGGSRSQQAVEYTGAGPNLKPGSTWSFAAGSPNVLTILIKDDEVALTKLLGDGLITIAWAMTCANDVVLGRITNPPHGGGPIPLPAGFLLMGTVLLGGGGIAHWRKRRARRAS